jgi:choline dehydrogenase-like flavoprotein
LFNVLNFRNSGGAGGNVIANRLTENPNFSVLVLEAGGSFVITNLSKITLHLASFPRSNEGVIDSIVPFFNIFLVPGSPYDWNYTTIAQVGLNGRALAYARGYILGGCTSTSESGFHKIWKLQQLFVS